MKNSRLQGVALAISLAGIVTVLSQACGQFNISDASSGSQSLGGPNQLAIQADADNPMVGQQVDFSTAGIALSANAIYSWTHSLSDASTGAPLPPCAILNGSALPYYPLQCSRAGKLIVSLTVVDGVNSYGPVLINEGVGVILPTPTPTPPSGPNPAGVALYSSTCAGCHGSLANSNISNRTVSGLTNAIASIGAMRGISLSAQQEQEIVDALNGH